MRQTPHWNDEPLYQGRRTVELKQYLREGGVQLSEWGENGLEELQEQINDGKCELGLDQHGEALRVASVVKVFIYDADKDLLLVNPLNSLENDTFLAQTTEINESRLKSLRNAVNVYQGRKQRSAVGTQSFYKVAMNQVNRSRAAKRSENVELPSALVFESTFSPFRETARYAAARVSNWRFSLKLPHQVFSKTVPMKERKYDSSHFPGLKSEYHVHHVRLKQEFVRHLQKAIPRNTLTPMCLETATNTGINTHWYCWMKASLSPEQMVKELGDLYTSSNEARALVGLADFRGEMAQTVGKALKEEADLINLWH